MQSILHRLAVAPAVIMVAALAVSPAIADTTNIKVPFSFEVAGKTFPAGDYSIRRDNRDGFVTLASKETSQSFTGIIGPGSPGPLDYKIALKFDQVGQTHLLQSIQYGTMITSKLDKKALQNERERGTVAHSGGR